MYYFAKSFAAATKVLASPLSITVNRCGFLSLFVFINSRACSRSFVSFILETAAFEGGDCFSYLKSLKSKSGLPLFWESLLCKDLLKSGLCDSFWSQKYWSLDSYNITVTVGFGAFTSALASNGRTGLKTRSRSYSWKRSSPKLVDSINVLKSPNSSPITESSTFLPRPEDSSSNARRSLKSPSLEGTVFLRFCLPMNLF